MGILINDEIVLPSGLKVKGAYAGFASNSILVTPVKSDLSPTGKVYSVNAPYCIWVSDECRKGGSEPLMVKQLQFEMGPDALNKGVYAVLYSQMCKEFTDYTNMDAQPPAAPAPAAAPASS